MAKLQFRVLYREFLFRMVDLEVLSAHALGDSNRLLGQFAALLLFISMLFSIAGFGFAGARMAPLSRLAFTLMSEHSLISTTMLVVGLFAVLSWDSTFPVRRDVLVLAPLPVRPRTMFLAKVAAVATALGLTVLLLHGAAGLIWPLAFAVKNTPLTTPVFTFDPTPVAVSAADLESVMRRDLHQALTSGKLAPGTGGGLAIGVWKHGESRVFAFGAARPDSMFEIGSITKTFTGQMFRQMVERGQVRLDEPIRELLPPDLLPEPNGPEITLLDLATHRSGLPRNVDGDWAEYLARNGVRRPRHPQFVYSNFGFGLLGQLLAKRAGVSYGELLRQQITGPLGMRDTVVPVSAGQQERLMQGYDANGHPVPWDPEGLAGSGAIRSTAGDMVKYLAVNLHSQSAANSGSSTPAVWMQNPATGVWSHGGAMAGFTSDAFFDPKHDYAAVVLLNRGPDYLGTVDLLSAHIRERLMGEPAVSLDTVFVPAASGVAGVLQWFAAYWITMLAAGAFTYCCVLCVQGLAAQLLPRRLFLRVSGLLQLGAFCLFVCVYFLQPGFTGMQGLTAPDIENVILWLPPYWFLGLFHSLNGSMHPVLAPLAQRGWIALAVALAGTAVAYALSYTRTLRQIVEEPDITPGSRQFNWLPRFGTASQTAIAQFSVRSLVRSTAASCDSGVLSGNRIRIHDLSVEGTGDAGGDCCQRLLASAQHSDPGGQRHDDGAGRGGDPGGVRAPLGSAGELDFPRHRCGWRARECSGLPALVVMVVGAPSVDRDLGDVFPAVAVAAGSGPLNLPWTAGTDGGRPLSSRLSKDALHVFVSAREIAGAHGIPGRSRLDVAGDTRCESGTAGITGAIQHGCPAGGCQVGGGSRTIGNRGTAQE